MLKTFNLLSIGNMLDKAKCNNEIKKRNEHKKKLSENKCQLNDDLMSMDGMVDEYFVNSDFLVNHAAFLNNKKNEINELLDDIESELYILEKKSQLYLCREKAIKVKIEMLTDESLKDKHNRDLALQLEECWTTVL
ncbi:hypothetical protein K6Y31_20310 [Motilimonas cestriensis]|uniref:Flagellar FliJ protein n=1 Tax=Motilimonas cestriensis TaxID=2742685 RepID=A0ABS8WDJ8_9GAMM|nr:hypothetical protein [Motilimonas cestriensis]MCE2597121.1 hypothetical protein [Motilimonas cestriensis]